MSACSSHRAYDGTWACVSSAMLRTSYMKRATHSSARVAPKGCMALSGGLSFINPSRSLAERAMRGSSAASSRLAGGMGREASHCSSGRATGSSPSSMESRLGPGPGQSDDDPGARNALVLHLGMVERPAMELNAVRERRRQHLRDQDAAEGGQLGLLLAGTRGRPRAARERSRCRSRPTPPSWPPPARPQRGATTATRRRPG